MPRFLIPARDSRHRIACFALYRALLKEAPSIKLPDNLVRAWGPGNPIKHLVRRTFRRNIADTSPRLVYSALKVGYQMLALLRAASPPTQIWARNLNHESIITYLRARLKERNATLEAKERHPPNSRNPARQSSAPRPETVPLLVNVTPAPTPENPNPKTVYATPHRPRPASELGGTGRRQVPRLDLAQDFPFLRIKKPQPPILSRVLTQKILRRVKRFDALGAFWEETAPDAEFEDAWDREVALRLGQGYSDVRGGNTYKSTIMEHAIDHLHVKLNEERFDAVARADAMRNLIEEETMLAEQEKVQRIREKRAAKRERKEGGTDTKTKTDQSQSEGWEKLVAASQGERKSRPVMFME
ncbi:hypothetical protein F4781DRAFT_186655 [Annulohypoxylon bovei var. microspora]|nr:hypothetical protein F4781DRAFT_186655 [Annulohypoxylon bovei var. microspora]